MNEVMIQRNGSRKPTNIAHEWLKLERQKSHGHISTWDSDTMDKYHRDLGLLVDFVTDCWPDRIQRVRKQ